MYTYMQTKIDDKNGVITLIPFTKVVKIPFTTTKMGCNLLA